MQSNNEPVRTCDAVLLRYTSHAERFKYTVHQPLPTRAGYSGGIAPFIQYLEHFFIILVIILK